MSTQKLVNISLSDFEKFLKAAGCEFKNIKGGHAHWTKQGLTRQITYQTHKDPIPVHVVKSILLDLKMTAKDYFEIMNKL